MAEAPKGCRAAYMSNLSFKLDEPTLRWWVEQHAGDVKAVEILSGGKKVCPAHCPPLPARRGRMARAQPHAVELGRVSLWITFETRHSEPQGKKAQTEAAAKPGKAAAHAHAGCAVVHFETLEAVEQLRAQDGGQLLGRKVCRAAPTECPTEVPACLEIWPGTMG